MSVKIILATIFLLPGMVTLEEGWRFVVIWLFCFAVSGMNFYRAYLLRKLKKSIRNEDYKLVRARCVGHKDSSHRIDDDVYTDYIFEDENKKYHMAKTGTGLLNYFDRFNYFGKVREGDELYIININKRTIYFKIK